jgi:hypothetical protein
MNTDNGYNIISVNPSYISTWYQSFNQRAKRERIAIEGPPVRFTEADGPIFKLQQLFECGQGNTYSQSLKPANLANNDHKGIISKVAAKKMKKSISYLVFLAKPKYLPDTYHGKGMEFKLNLITLTLSSTQLHSDIEIKKKIFHPMLQSFRHKFGVLNYIWRAEKQGNGNIHFHIITDKYIPWLELRNEWNKFQQNLGYVTGYRATQEVKHKAGFHLDKSKLKTWPEEKQYASYLKGLKCQWDNPNSSDVHSLRSVKNVEKYFVKYFTKDTQSADDRPGEKQQFSNLAGRLWGCSYDLTNIKGARADVDSEIGEELLKLSKDPSVRIIRDDFFVFIQVSIEYLIAQGYHVLTRLFESYIQLTFPAYRPPDLFTVAQLN